MLKALDADRSVLIATQGVDRNVYLGGRNIPKAIIKPAAEINAYDVLSTRTMVITKAAFEDVLKTATPSKVAAPIETVKRSRQQKKTKAAKANG